MYNVFLIERNMTIIALMSAILVFSTFNSFKKFKNELANFFQRFAFKVLKANRWKIFESFLKANRVKIFESKSLAKFWKLAGEFYPAIYFQKFESYNRWLKFASD